MEEQDYQAMEDMGFNSNLQAQELQQIQQARMMEEQNRGLIKEQLDLREELEKIDHLLRGHVQVRNKDNELVWVEPKNNENAVLSDAGINLVLNSIQWYLTKNTLLSNYDEETIRIKMEDFAISLADALFMNYGKYFLYPSLKDCYEALVERLERKQEDEIYSLKIKGYEVTDDNKIKIWNKLIKEIDPSKEMAKIKEQIIKDKLKLFDLLLREIQDSVHSAYNRAFRGEERRTLRQHTHVSEIMNPGVNNQPKQESGFNFFRGR